MSTDLRTNERIRAREIRVVGNDGGQIGIMPLKQALSIAEEKALDLVEVAPQAKPPVCKIMDYGKYKYEQAKKAKEAKKNQNIMKVKEVQMSVKIEDHDFNVKVNMAKRFLENKDKVKVRIRFRGREIAHKDIAYDLMNRFAEEVKDLGQISSKPSMEGRHMLMFITPISDK
ncbi:translation initiation factor IF-3 [Orenia metallireducens]|uniref:Translation initiation factor IF-3 n=1 Tax=Orenia metallireducens TaxID=1413210 RepID=A0A1C0AAY8_9FIRM|nr:translation initiation factor IF-3 [Orenia metallireducens]OCL27537.1 translation initiation factor IF-3 [Orenia metallireducens]